MVTSTRRRRTPGQEAKAAGIALAQSSRRSLDWRNAAAYCLFHLIREGAAVITSESITSRVGQPPSSGQVGAVMNSFAVAGWIERIPGDEFMQAERVNQHAALISRWRPTRLGIEIAGAQDAQGSLW